MHGVAVYLFVNTTAADGDNDAKRFDYTAAPIERLHSNVGPCQTTKFVHLIACRFIKSVVNFNKTV